MYNKMRHVERETQNGSSIKLKIIQRKEVQDSFSEICMRQVLENQIKDLAQGDEEAAHTFQAYDLRHRHDIDKKDTVHAFRQHDTLAF